MVLICFHDLTISDVTPGNGIAYDNNIELVDNNFGMYVSIFTVQSTAQKCVYHVNYDDDGINHLNITGMRSDIYIKGKFSSNDNVFIKSASETNLKFYTF